MINMQTLEGLMERFLDVLPIRSPEDLLTKAAMRGAKPEDISEAMANGVSDDMLRYARGIAERAGHKRSLPFFDEYLPDAPQPARTAGANPSAPHA